MSVTLTAAPECTYAAAPNARVGGLPADWPAALPVPPGAIQGSTGSAGQWSVLILVNGSAADVLRSAHDFYATAGFTSDSNATLHDASYRIVLVAENRDHSSAETNLVVGVTAMPPAQTPTGPSQAPTTPASAGTLIARILPSPRVLRLATARRTGLRVAFTAPAATHTAIIRGFRLVRARRQPIGSRSATVHAGRNLVALDSVTLRDGLRRGHYQLEVMLRAADGSRSTPARITLTLR